jgi:hypothetical protein
MTLVCRSLWLRALEYDSCQSACYFFFQLVAGWLELYTRQFRFRNICKRSQSIVQLSFLAGAVAD